jgi:predicted permease
MNDLKLAFRQLTKNPGFTAVAVITLALGIGANTAIFSVVNGVLFRPLAYKEPDRIVTILHDGRNPVAPADFLDWREQSLSFERMAAAEAWGGTLTGGERPEAIAGIRMGEGLMELLGVAPLLGRTFQADDYLPGNEHVLVLSHRLWQRRFGGSREVVGKTVTLDGKAYIVIGVMPSEFQFAPFWMTKSELWAPLPLADRANNRALHSLRVFGRLKAGVARAKAQAEMDTICRRLEQAYPATNAGRTVRVDALLDKVVGDIRRGLLVLLGAVIFVLLIACANVANLLLVRAAAREREMAIRAALGAGRWRTVRQLLTESFVLSLSASALGLVIGFVGVTALKDYVEGSASSFNIRLPRVHDIGIDPPTLLFTLGIALLTGLVFGLAPALQSVKADLQGTLKESSRGTSSGRRSGRLRAVLVVSEMALALVMLIGAGLLMRSFARLAGVDPGFKPKNVLSMTVSLAGQNDFIGPKREAFYDQLLQKIESLPGVKSASAINHLPLAGDMWSLDLAIEGRPLPAPGQGIAGVYRVCLPKYFSTMGMSLLRGRDFSEQDRLGSPEVVIINESLMRREFPDENPLGKRVTLDRLPNPNPEWLTIIGVVKDAKQRSLTDNANSEFYLPWRQTSAYLEQTGGHVAYMTLVIRTATNPLALIDGVQRAVWSLNRSAPVSGITTLEEVMANAVWRERFNLILIAIFAWLALLLASVGIYGVMAYSVGQRTQELGIRLALGAQKRDLLGLVLGQGMRLALLGAMIGLAGALALSRFLQSLLFGVSPIDGVTFVGAPVVLAFVALLACWLPARRATRIDPISALRHE